jgi:hypothetical protein
VSRVVNRMLCRSTGVGPGGVGRSISTRVIHPAHAHLQA